MALCPSSRPRFFGVCVSLSWQPPPPPPLKLRSNTTTTRHFLPFTFPSQSHTHNHNYGYYYNNAAGEEEEVKRLPHRLPQQQQQHLNQRETHLPASASQPVRCYFRSDHNDFHYYLDTLPLLLPCLHKNSSGGSSERRRRKPGELSKRARRSE